MQLRSGRVIENNGSPYFIAEMNSSHGGNIEIAKKMIDEAKNAGCHCVKFQSWSKDTLYSEEYYKENPIAKRFVKKFSLSPEQLKELAEYSGMVGIDFASTPYAKEEARFLMEECNVPFLKVASMDINNHGFLRYMAEFGVPIILSTGMSTLEEVKKAVDIITETGNRQICILHCVSLYPTSFEKVNLRNILELRDVFPEYPIGYSDHTVGTEVPVAAMALGAAVLEKHFTLDNSKIGMDNQMATTPEQFQSMIGQCMNAHKAMGNKERVLCKEEIIQQQKMRRSIVLTRDIEKGETLSITDLDVKRPGTGIPPCDLECIVGKKVLYHKEKDSILYYDDLC